METDTRDVRQLLYVAIVDALRGKLNPRCERCLNAFRSDVKPKLRNDMQDGQPE